MENDLYRHRMRAALSEAFALLDAATYESSEYSSMSREDFSRRYIAWCQAVDEFLAVDADADSAAEEPSNGT